MLIKPGSIWAVSPPYKTLVFFNWKLPIDNATSIMGAINIIYTANALAHRVAAVASERRKSSLAVAGLLGTEEERSALL